MKFLTVIIFAISIFATAPAFGAQKLVESDERIKTFVYDPSEIYRIITRSNFQTTIEFGSDETIDTLSIGDSIGWQLTPAGKRLFLKPIHKSGITNLSVITNRRSYQFELVATSSSNLSSSHSYVIRFYYPQNTGYTGDVMPYESPDERSRNYLRPVSATPIPTIPQPYIPPQPTISAPLPGEYVAPAPAAVISAPNYNYTLSGSNTIAPLRVYDDGANTYFQFPNSVKNPQISVVTGQGAEYPLTVNMKNGMFVVNAVAPKMSIKQGAEAVFVYNENKANGGY